MPTFSFHWHWCRYVKWCNSSTTSPRFTGETCSSTFTASDKTFNDTTSLISSRPLNHIGSSEKWGQFHEWRTEAPSSKAAQSFILIIEHNKYCYVAWGCRETHTVIDNPGLRCMHQISVIHLCKVDPELLIEMLRNSFNNSFICTNY